MRMKDRITWILVCDGARGRILAHRRRDKELREIGNSERRNARQPTRNLEADKPGRTFDSKGAARHSLAPPTDWHQFEKTLFAKEMAAIVNDAALSDRYDRLILVAPPRVLGNLRVALNHKALEMLDVEINKDLTNVPTHDLGAHLATHVSL